MDFALPLLQYLFTCSEDNYGSYPDVITILSAEVWEENMLSNVDLWAGASQCGFPDIK